MKDKTCFWIYILECKNNKYYTGYTVDMEKRFGLHHNGKGAKFTRSFKPVRIAQCWKLLDTKSQAMKIESFIKQKPRFFKEDIINNPGALKKALYEKYELRFKLKEEKCKKHHINRQAATGT